MTKEYISMTNKKIYFVQQQEKPNKSKLKTAFRSRNM